MNRSMFLLMAVLAAPMAFNSPVAAQFIWDGDCSLYWNDCCYQDEAYVNNWATSPNPTACPPLPGPDDHVTVVKTVIMQNPPASTWLNSLTITSTIDQAVHFTSFNNFSVDDFLVLSGNIVQPATWVFKNGPVEFQDPEATMTISSFATLDFQTDGAITGHATALLTNNGLILKSIGGEALSGFGFPVENNNTIRTLDGMLVFYESLTNYGLIDALLDTEIRFQGPNTVLDGEVQGDGLIRFLWGDTTITGNFHPTNTLIAGGAAIVNFEVDTSIENLTIGNSVSVGGAGDLTIDDLLWNGGYSTINPGGTITVLNSASILYDTFAGGSFALNREMELHGQSVISAGALLAIDGGELRNEGELQLLGNATIGQPCCTPNSTIRNFGSLRKLSGGTSLINVTFFNFGDIEVESGALDFDGEMSNQDSIIINAGTTLLMGHHQQTIHETGSITGEGEVFFYNDFFSGDTTVDSMLGEYNVGSTTVQAGTVSFDTDGNIAPTKTTGPLNLIQGFGTTKLQGNANLIVTDQFHWAAGEMAGSGGTFVHGPMIVTGGVSLDRLLELNVDAPPGKQPPTWTMYIKPLGTLHCRNVTIDTHVHNEGLVSPGTPTVPVGELHVTGGYTQTAGGQLAVSRHGSAHDQLIVDGPATINGTLNASGFPTSGGQSFTILTAADVQGTFAQVNLPSGMQVIYTANAVILQAAPGAPCPADITGDQLVNVNDLLTVINGWGPCSQPCPPNCVADITQDCSVNVNDLLAVINLWGPCR